MTQTHGRVTGKGEEAIGSRAILAGAHQPGGARPCVASAATVLEVKSKDGHGQRLLVLALLAAVIVADQTAKWWAWRHVPGARINPGGDVLTGPTVGRWYARPVLGALLDLLDFGLVSIAVTILARRRRPAAVTVCGSLMVGGWGSNLLDRLGMHYWTAPGSIRGVVDFMNVGGHRYNLADFFIVGATPLFLSSAACLARRVASRPAAAAPPRARSWLRARTPVVALAAAALIMTVGLGAAHDGRLIRPSPAGAKCCQLVHSDHGVGGSDRNWYWTIGRHPR